MQRMPQPIIDVGQKLQLVAQRVGTLDLLIDPTNPNSLTEARETLQSIVDELQEIARARDHSNLSANDRIVVSEIDELLNHTLLLKEQIDNSISENQVLYETINNHSTSARAASTTAAAPDASVEEPLSQEEIRQLLFLVSQAHNLNILTASQKGLIKDQICKRTSFMRLMLNVDDVTITLSSMKEIASYLEKNT
jgi:hypothetical protein